MIWFVNSPMDNISPFKLVTSDYSQVGFEMIDVIAEAEGISLSSMQFKAMVGKGNILTKDCLNFKLKPGMVPLLDLVRIKLSSFPFTIIKPFSSSFAYFCNLNT